MPKLFVRIAANCRRCQPHMVYRSTAEKETGTCVCDLEGRDSGQPNLMEQIRHPLGLTNGLWSGILLIDWLVSQLTDRWRGMGHD